MSRKKQNLSFFLFLMSTILLALITLVIAEPAHAQNINTDVYKQLKYRFIGPQGNRVIAVVGVMGKPNICYAGSASGGIFKSVDGGDHWNAIFDDQPVSSIGSIAIASFDPNIIWAGTGETFIRSNVSQGMGIYKSADAGQTWQCMGLKKTGRIGRVIIHPQDPNIVFAAAMGHCFGPQQERGVFRTVDGGQTWERVLFVDENTGCSDIVMDPNNPRILLAGMWPMEIAAWLERKSGGPGGGIYMSRDGGKTWKHLEGHGLPEPPIGKVALAMSASNSNRIYALIESKEGVLWRSDDGGQNWELINRDHTLTQRPAYYSRCAVAPDDENEVYFLAVRFIVSYDGGETFKVVSREKSPGGDNHDMWIDPTNPDRMLVGNDGGIRISMNHGQNWNRPRLPNAQMYHVYVDNRIPYYVYGNRQDGPSTRGPSNSLTRGGITSCLWHSVGGGESGFAVPDPVDNNIVWSGHYESMLDRYDLCTGQARAVSAWPDSTIGRHAALLKYRFQWTFPILISPHDHNTVYIGSQYVHKTTDGGHSWTIISPDLSTNDKKKQQPFKGVTRDDESSFSCCIFALAESPLEKGLIWAGTNDGQVQITRDGGANWTNVTSNIPDFPSMGIISNIEPSRYAVGTCYISVDFHNANIRDPYAYKTADYGKSWRLISSDIPKSELSYVHCIREDPVRRGLLYLGIENALYISFDDGRIWNPLNNNLPHAPVHWLVIQEHFNDLVVGTYGRGFWILDDISPFQQLTPEIMKSKVHLFEPRPAYRFRMISETMGCPDDQSLGQNPPYGACINYYLKEIPKQDVKIEIFNDKGNKMKTINGTKKAGINRIWWDLRDEPSKEVKLRTSPLGSPWVKVGPKGWRSLTGSGSPIRILISPGIYTVKLMAAENELTQNLEVRKDPHSSGSLEDIQVQLNLLEKIRDNMSTLVGMINKIEWIRKQIYNLEDLLEGEEEIETIIKAGKDLDKKLIEVEEPLFQMKLTGGTATQDILRWPCKLYRRISSLASQVAQSDFPPTTQMIKVHEMYKKQVSEQKSRLKEILEKDMPALNKLLKEKNFPHILVKTN